MTSRSRQSVRLDLAWCPSYLKCHDKYTILVWKMMHKYSLTLETHNFVSPNSLHVWICRLFHWGITWRSSHHRRIFVAKKNAKKMRNMYEETCHRSIFNHFRYSWIICYLWYELVDSKLCISGLLSQGGHFEMTMTTSVGIIWRMNESSFRFDLCHHFKMFTL